MLGSPFQQSQCCVRTGHVLGQLSFLQHWTWLASLNWPLWVCSWPGRLEGIALSSLREEIAVSSPCLQYPAKCLLNIHMGFTNTSIWHFQCQGSGSWQITESCIVGQFSKPTPFFESFTFPGIWEAFISPVRPWALTTHCPGICLSAESPCQDLRDDYEGFSLSSTSPRDRQSCTESSHKVPSPIPSHNNLCDPTARMCMKMLEIIALELLLWGRECHLWWPGQLCCKRCTCIQVYNRRKIPKCLAWTSHILLTVPLPAPLPQPILNMQPEWFYLPHAQERPRSLWWMRPHALTSSPYSCTCSLTSPEPGTLLQAWVLASTSTQSILTPESNWCSPSLPSGLCSKLNL